MAISSIKQAGVLVAVDYCDAEERAKLSKYPSSAHIAAIAGSQIEIPVAEFLTYYLFHLKRTGLGAYGSYPAIATRIARAEKDLDDFVEFNGKSISRAPGVTAQIPRITEHIGEAIGLAVVNRIHDLTEADWTPIPQMRGRSALPTFDYQEGASDAKNIIQLEAKGTAVDETNLTASIRTHRTNISDKKIHIADSENTNGYPYPASVRYGSIAVLPTTPQSPVRCLLSDPPADSPEGLPKNIRLLKRQAFILQWLRLIAPRSEIVVALSNRLNALIQLADPGALNGTDLIRGNGEQFDLVPTDDYGHTRFFQTRSTVTDGPAGGVTVQIDNKSLFFLGVREEVLSLAVDQNFEDITGYRANVASIPKSVDAVFSGGRYRALRLSASVAERFAEIGGDYHIRLQGNLHYTPEGLVFGELPIDTD